MEVSVQLDAPAAVPPGKLFLVPFEYEEGLVTEPVWMFRRKETPLTPAGN
jgi:hypothetical protein